MYAFTQMSYHTVTLSLFSSSISPISSLIYYSLFSEVLYYSNICEIKSKFSSSISIETKTINCRLPQVCFDIQLCLQYPWYYLINKGTLLLFIITKHKNPTTYTTIKKTVFLLTMHAFIVFILIQGQLIHFWAFYNCGGETGQAKKETCQQNEATAVDIEKLPVK